MIWIYLFQHYSTHWSLVLEWPWVPHGVHHFAPPRPRPRPFRRPRPVPSSRYRHHSTEEGLEKGFTQGVYEGFRRRRRYVKKWKFFKWSFCAGPVHASSMLVQQRHRIFLTWVHKKFKIAKAIFLKMNFGEIRYASFVSANFSHV